MHNNELIADSALAEANDDRVSLGDACKFLPSRNGKRPHLYTVRRWTSKGVKGAGGGIVRLRAFRVGGSWFTRLAWVREFIAALTDGMDGTDDGRSSAQLEIQPPKPNRALTEARRRLIARGVLREETETNLLGVQ